MRKIFIDTTWPTSGQHRYLACLWGACILACSLATWAGHIYTFKDAQGNILLTNLVNPDGHPQGLAFRRYTVLSKVAWYPDSNMHRYHNWGRDEASVQGAYGRNVHAYDRLIATQAAANGLDKGLVLAIIHTESGFNPYAISPPGARGLMQLMPATARRYHVADAFDPAQNIRGGTLYLRDLLQRFKSLELALAAYNAGEKNVIKYGGIPPFSETQDYVHRVISRYRHLYGGGIY